MTTRFGGAGDPSAFLKAVGIWTSSALVSQIDSVHRIGAGNAYPQRCAIGCHAAAQSFRGSSRQLAAPTLFTIQQRKHLVDACGQHGDMRAGRSHQQLVRCKRPNAEIDKVIAVGDMPGQLAGVIVVGGVRSQR